MSKSQLWEVGILENLENRLSREDYQKLLKISNFQLWQFVADAIRLCNPANIFVCDDSPEDIKYIRETAVRNGEEIELAIPGHTIHFDAYGDQGRDKKNTLILLSGKAKLDSCIETGERRTCLKEVREILKNIMAGKEMLVCFSTLGPPNSEFSIPCVQITDSSYVKHSEDILYYGGYAEFARQGPNTEFFKFLHSQGEVDERKVSKNLDKRRIYIDRLTNTVYTSNTQYAGNSVGLKKLALRLAIQKAAKEGWLAEHMAIFGIKGPDGRITYFAGAFPSFCGKTTTAMQEGGTIIGDDLSYARIIIVDGVTYVYIVNVEKGMFGIITDVSVKDRHIWKALHSPGEVIFSNVLDGEDRRVHWIGKGEPVPQLGQNHSGQWHPGKKDAAGKEIPISHPNARFTLSLELLENLDPNWNNPRGVPLGAIVYGGRDSDTNVPVAEAFDWQHGIINMAASLESETTAATLGKEGVRDFDPMSNLQFLSVPLAKYIQNNLKFGKKAQNPPTIFLVNYFLKDKNGNFLNDREDKRVWYKWMELRVHREVWAIETPVGRIPKYKDLKKLFQEVLGKEYALEEYKEQFLLRIPEHLAKIERIENIYRTEVLNPPKIVFRLLREQRERLLLVKKAYRKDYILPTEMVVN